MLQILDSGDRKLLMGAGVLLAVLLFVSAVTAPQQISGPAAFPSSYSPSWDGAKAAFLLLQQSGYRIERWEKPPTELDAIPDSADGSTRVLVLTQPVEEPADEERFAIRRFLEDGGQVLATGAGAAKFLPQAAEFEAPQGEAAQQKPEHLAALISSPLTRAAPEITMADPIRWKPKSPEQALYGNGGTAAVITYAVGKGRVIWWGAATPLTNGYIRDSGNLALFLNCIATSGTPNGVHVFWDEYFHGVHGSLWSYVARTPLPWAIAQFGLVFVAVIATYSRRLGTIRPPVVVSRASALEFVETMGDLYYSARAVPAAIRIGYQRLRFLLTRQLALPSNVSAGDLARSASQQLGWQESALRDTLTGAERVMNASDQQPSGRSRRASNGRNSYAGNDTPLRVVQQLYDYCARLEIKRSGGTTERPAE